MITQKVIVENDDGLHARPATHLVKIASRFKSEIFLVRNKKKVNGKSIMGVMMLAAAKGNEILLKIDGEDEQQAMAALVDLFVKKFYIEEKINEKKPEKIS